MTKQGREGSFFAKPSTWMLDLAKRGQEVVGRDKMKAVGLDLAKAGDRRWSAVTKRRRWGSFLPN